MVSAVASVTLQSCTLAVPAGPVTLGLTLPPAAVNTPVAVEGAPAGAWVQNSFYVETTIAEGEQRAVTLTVQGSAPVTYRLTGVAAKPFLSSGPTKEGPWTPVTAGGLMPGEHGWLMIQYPRPMMIDQPAPYSADQYWQPGTGLTGEWIDTERQVIPLAGLPRVLFGVERRKDQDGLTLHWAAPRRLYRGAPPELLAMKPRETERTLHTFTTEPAHLRSDAESFIYSTPAGWMEHSLATGAERAVAYMAPTEGFLSPDGKLIAKLRFPTEQWNGTQVSGDLLITEVETGNLVLAEPGWITSQGLTSCSPHGPAFGWRPDSRAFVALDAPAPDRLVLKEGSIAGESRVIAEQRFKNAGYKQWETEVNWSPDGRLIVFADQLVQAADGKVVSEGIRPYSYWSPDGRFLLEYEKRHPFTQWGQVVLRPVVGSDGRLLAGEIPQPLGNGLALGWTAAGEAVWIRWTVEAETPPPGKGCP